MIFFNCNYCDELELIPYAFGKVQKVKCKKCKKICWLFHSNIDPESLTSEEFNKKYIVDEKTKKITLKRKRRLNDPR